MAKFFRLFLFFGLVLFGAGKIIHSSLNPFGHEVKFSAKSARGLSKFVSRRSPASALRSGLNVTIAEGEVAYLDESTSIDTLTINGELHCDEDHADELIELRVKTIHVNGVFQCGTTSNPYSKKFIISLKDSTIDPKVSPAYRGIIIMGGGKLILNGESKKAGWVRLGQNANPGDDFIVLEDRRLRSLDAIKEQFQLIKQRKVERTRSLVFSWIKSVLPVPVVSKSVYNYLSNDIYRQKFKVGDKIAIGPTGYDYSEAESFTVTAIDAVDPRKVYIDGTIQHLHWGEKRYYDSNAMGRVLLDESAEVANLTRNIVIRADEKYGLIDEGTSESSQRGGHIMVHHMGKAYINSVELYKLGQAGVMARYPFHWHHVGDAPGQYVKNSSIHHSYQRCITVHRTNKVLLQNNVCFNFKGHGYFLEDGSEIENKIIRNLAMKATAPSANKLLLASDDIANSEGQGRFPSVSGFWISNPDNYIVYNVASGSVGTGIWMSFEDEVKDMQGNIVATPINEITDTFNFNTAHSGKVGITWDGAPGWVSANNPNNPNDLKLANAHYNPPNVPVFRGLKAYKNSMSGIYFRGQSVVYKDTIVADNGWSFWVSYNQIVQNSVFIGRTDNLTPEMEEKYFADSRYGRYRRTGMVLYDGPFEIHNSDFIDFDTEEHSYDVSSWQTVNTTYVPFTATGGSEKFTNFVSGLSFSPEPIHRIHLESEDIYDKARQSLGNSTIRDMDGSLTGTGVNSVVVGKRSMAVTAADNCVEGGESFYNLLICPEEYTEGSFTFMRWGSSQASPWGTPFVVMRNDGKTSYPFDEWNRISGIANNLFATINSEDYSYTLLPKYQYEKDRTIGATARLSANTESESPLIPVVKIIAYGKNCHLDDDAVEATSLADLKTKTQTSYFADGEDFYVRVVPEYRWQKIADDPVVQATALRSDTRYSILCDEGYLEPRVIGKIERVLRGPSSTTVEGWACNYTKSSSINVKLYAYGSPIAVPHDDYQSAIESRNVATDIKTYTLLKQEYSNDESTPEINMACGYLTELGRKFNITIPNTELAAFTDHKFYVKGLSNSGGNDAFIERSGDFSVLGLQIQTQLIER
ncbi:MAG: hypothetical protein ACI9QD_000571 [Thermoproteota archaeon]|jgi:hypothetical protein